MRFANAKIMIKEAYTTENLECKKYPKWELHEKEIETDSDNIKLQIPGKKTDISVYDFRLLLNIGNYKYFLTHANIIIDLYTKIKYNPSFATNLREFIVDIAINGLREENRLERYGLDKLKTNQFVKTEYKNIAAECVPNYNKYFNYRTCDMNLLRSILFWVTLQEDINYPIDKGCQGRRLAFTRFVESIYCAEHDYEDSMIRVVLTNSYNHGRGVPDLMENLQEEYLYAIKLVQNIRE
ncbi:hypothetical protein [Candidatus Clostridium radicumherbarum]|uniref:Uncharacterized protein n=1 Tax=Candidatus Clostridium radicumherbarum TaxID=3381662 RepID=A0ABW8TNR6_9CLOT